MMASPASPFDAERHVSDVLEGLLDARSTRDAVRAYCVSLLAGLPNSLLAQLLPIATYFGGKCMGFPAIWFFEKVLAGTITRTEEIIERCRRTLCVSLSTSIVDDLADHDETVDNASLAFLYVLLGEATFSKTATAPDALIRLHQAIDICLNPSAPTTGMAITRRGNRIGAFFAMMAADVFHGFYDASRAAYVIEAAERFGELCAHADDWMDVERDLDRGITDNVVLTLLQTRLSGRTPAITDLQYHRRWLSEQFSALLSQRAVLIVQALMSFNGGGVARSIAPYLLRFPESVSSL
jgi:hypothetical protein